MPAIRRSHSRAFKHSTRFSSYLYMLVNTLTWGVSLIIVKPALAHASPFRFLFYRYAIAAVISLPILIHYWPKIRHRRTVLRNISLLELLGTTFALSLLYFGLDRTSAIEASLLATTAPIFTTIFGILFLREKEERHEITGLFLAVAGTILLTLFPLLLGHRQLNGLSLEGNVLIIGQNISIGLYYVLAKKYYQKLPKLFVTTISFYIGLISFALLSLIEAGSARALLAAIYQDFTHPAVWIASGYMALFGSVIGLTAYIKGQDGIEASEAAVFTYLQPLVYLPLGVLLLNEHIYTLQLVSLGLIFLGVLAAERRT